MPVARYTLLVEDDPFAGKAMVEFLTDLGFFVHLAANKYQAIDFLQQRTDWTMFFTDLSLLPGGQDQTGIELIHRARAYQPRLPVILWTAYPFLTNNLAELFAQYHTGIACIPKGSSTADIEAAIHLVTNGQVYFYSEALGMTAHPADALLSAMPSDVREIVERIASQIDALSPRLREVAGLMTYRTEEIADLLSINPKTIYKYRDKLFDTFDLREFDRFNRDTVIALAALLTQLRNPA